MLANCAVFYAVNCLLAEALAAPVVRELDSVFINDQGIEEISVTEILTAKQ